VAQQRRCPPEIVAQILEATLRAQRKTQIMYHVRIDFRTLERYLAYLMEKGLLEQDGLGYRATKNGRLFVEKYREASRLLEN